MTSEEARNLIIKQIKDRKMNFFIRPNGDRPSEIIQAYFLREIAALEMGADALKDRPQREWIPVSDRLPEKNGYYLTTTVHHEVYCDFWEEDRFDRAEAVIAWMPLPEPYKVEPQESNDKCKNCEYYCNPDYRRCHECKAERSGEK